MELISRNKELRFRISVSINRSLFRCLVREMLRAFLWLVLTLRSLILAANSGNYIVYNARIYSMERDSQGQLVEAFCVRNGRFVQVGSLSTVRKRCPSAEVLDYSTRFPEGATVFPGFIDSHAHLMEEGKRRIQVNLEGCDSEKCILQRIVDFTKVSMEMNPYKEQEWIIGFGWDQNEWKSSNHSASRGNFPTKDILDTLPFPQIPIMLRRIDGHACWINSAALKMIGHIPQDDPIGGRIIRDSDGNPTGIFTDNAMKLVDDVIPPMNFHKRILALNEVLKACRENGITAIHNPGVTEEDIQLYKYMIDTGNFTLRNYVFRLASKDSPFNASKILGYGNGRLTVQAVKFFMDGALGSWGSAMLEPYNDRLNSSGYLIYNPDQFFLMVKDWIEHGWQVATHAIGDRANRVVLDTYEQIISNLSLQSSDIRFRIEHAQIIHPIDIPRFGELGIIPSMQPTHCTSDMGFAEIRLGHFRAQNEGYVWNSLLKSGVEHLPLGSDFPTVGQVPPILGIYAACTRKDIKGNPPGGWFPEQALHRFQAIKGYTMDAAFAGFQEKELGSISPGKYADFVIWDRDLMTVSEEELLDAQVLETNLAGEKVFSRVHIS